SRLALAGRNGLDRFKPVDQVDRTARNAHQAGSEVPQRAPDVAVLVLGGCPGKIAISMDGPACPSFDPVRCPVLVQNACDRIVDTRDARRLLKIDPAQRLLQDMDRSAGLPEP